jgi:hypothetical protein
MITKEQFRDALLEAGAKSLASANGLATRLFKKRNEISEDELVEYYTGSKSRFKDAILKHFDLSERKLSRNEQEEKEILKIMFSNKEIPTFERKLGENDFELIERYAIQAEKKKPKMAKFLADRATHDNKKVKINSKYFALCSANK